MPCHISVQFSIMDNIILTKFGLNLINLVGGALENLITGKIAQKQKMADFVMDLLILMDVTLKLVCPKKAHSLTNL